MARGSTGLDLFKSVKHYHRDGPTIKHVYTIGSDGDLYIGATADLDPAKEAAQRIQGLSEKPRGRLRVRRRDAGADNFG